MAFNMHPTWREQKPYFEPLRVGGKSLAEALKEGKRALNSMERRALIRAAWLELDWAPGRTTGTFFRRGGGE